jgi:hypothetical protein
MNMNTRLTLTLLIGLTSTCAALAQAPYDQYLMTWNATGYTTDAKGHVVASSLGPQAFINRIAADNGLNPATLCFVYRAEKRDTAVVVRSTGEFIADVYQTEYYYTDITNASDTATYRQAYLDDEYHTNPDGSPNPIGSTFGVETKTVDKNGNITSYSYHGNFQYVMPGPPTPLDPEVNTVWTGTFSTGARIPYRLPITSLDKKRSQTPRLARFQPPGKDRSIKRGGELLAVLTK